MAKRECDKYKNNYEHLLMLVHVMHDQGMKLHHNMLMALRSESEHNVMIARFPFYVT